MSDTQLSILTVLTMLINVVTFAALFLQATRARKALEEAQVEAQSATARTVVLSQRLRATIEAVEVLKDGGVSVSPQVLDTLRAWKDELPQQEGLHE